MRLEQLFEVMSSTDRVFLFDDLTGDLLASYDGKNSIPEKYNNWKVTFLTSVREDELWFTIREEND